MRILRLASCAGIPMECVVAQEGVFRTKMAHRPFRFLIAQQETGTLMFGRLRLCFMAMPYV